MAGSGEHNINMRDLFITISSKLAPVSPDCCIYRVPKRLQNVNQKAYTPQVVSIGPLHHGNQALLGMEEHKWRYFRHFIHNSGLTIDGCVETVKNSEDRIRGFYTDLLQDGFELIILLDAVFIIEILLRFSSDEFEDDVDRIYSKPWMIQHIVPDLLLLENQIPFFIVENFFTMAQELGCIKSVRNLKLNEVCYKFVKYNVAIVEATDESKAVNSLKFLHLVDLGRKIHVPDQHSANTNQAAKTTNRIGRVYGRAEPVATRLGSDGNRISVRRFIDGQNHEELSIKKLNVPTVTRLHRAGVKLKVGSGENMFKMIFNDGDLEIPKLSINDNTEIYLRNMIAFEQCHCVNFTITNYFVILKRLVVTTQDLELLLEHEIIDHSLGDLSEVLAMITKLADEVTVDYTDSGFIDVCKKMDYYCKVQWHQWKANLKQIYFDTPWTTLSVIAATFILILTAIQAVCSILSVK